MKSALHQGPIEYAMPLDWNEVTKVAHYYLSINAMSKPMELHDDPSPFRTQE